MVKVMNVKLSIVSYQITLKQGNEPLNIIFKLWSMFVRVSFGSAKWILFFLVVFVRRGTAKQSVSLSTLHELTLIVAFDLRDVRDDAELGLTILLVFLEEEGLLHCGASVICDIVVALVWTGTVHIKSARSLILIFILPQFVIWAILLWALHEEAPLVLLELPIVHRLAAYRTADWLCARLARLLLSPVYDLIAVVIEDVTVVFRASLP